MIARLALSSMIALSACWHAEPSRPRHRATEDREPPRGTASRTTCPPPGPLHLATATPEVGAIAGTVVDEQCAPISGAKVVARLQGEYVIHAEVTDAAGGFAFLRLVPGGYTISAYYGESKLERGGVVIGAGVVEQVQLELPPQPPPEPWLMAAPPP